MVWVAGSGLKRLVTLVAVPKWPNRCKWRCNASCTGVCGVCHGRGHKYEILASCVGRVVGGGVAVITLAATFQARAADVYWSVGVQSGPAVVVPSRPAYPPPRVVYAPPPPPPAVVVVSPGYAVPPSRWDGPQDRRYDPSDHHRPHRHHHWRDERESRESRDNRRAGGPTCYHQDVGYFDCNRGPGWRR